MNTNKSKLLFSFFLLFLLSTAGYGQYGNEWINSTQTYYKIKVASNGIYKITYNTLVDAGLPVSSINPVNIQIYREGQEQTIYVSGQNDNSLDAGDYIEFYGQYNDGKNENDMYMSPQEQPHQYISLYTDTSNYYLTWTAATPGKRLAEYQNNNFSGKTADSWIWFKSHYFVPKYYFDGSQFTDVGYFSEFTQGEGWYSDYAYQGLKPKLSVPTPAYNSSGPSPECTFGIYGTSDPIDRDGNGINHKIEVTIGTTKVFEKFFEGYTRVEPGYGGEPKLYLNSSLIGSGTTDLTFTSAYLSRGRISVTHADIQYPRNLDLLNSSYFEFDYKGANDYFSFSNYSGSAPYIYDLTNNNIIVGTLTGTTLSYNASKNGIKKLVIADESTKKPISVANLTKVAISKPIKPITQDYDYVIITNRLLANGAEQYKQYRESAQGGGHKVLVSYTEDIYEEFYYGIHHPKAIRNFCKYLYQQQGTPPLHLLLLGKGQTLDLIRFNDSRKQAYDLVPTWGYPPSDYPFVTDYTPDDLSPAIAIGRVPARSDQEVLDYLEKVQQHESGTNLSKKILYLTGGSGVAEQNQLKVYQNIYFDIAKQPKMGADADFISKADAGAIDETLTQTIQQKIDDGLNMVSYFGHGASQILELDMGDARDLDNEGNYPLFIFNGCALANSFGDNSLAEEFILEPKKGAIAWLASSSFGFISPLYSWTTAFYKNAADFHYGESIGRLIRQTHKDYQRPSDNFNRAQCRQMMFHGDPAIKLNSLPKPDYTFKSSQIQFLPENLNAEMDSIALRFDLVNHGLATNDTPNVYVSVRYSNDSIATFGPKKFGTLYNNQTIDFWIQNSKFSRGNQTFTVTIDYGNNIDENAPMGELNNTLTAELYLPSNSLSTLYPTKDGIEPSTKVTLKAQLNNPLAVNEELIFEIDSTPLFNSPILQNSGIVTGQNIVSHDFVLPSLDSTDFFWRVKFNKTEEEGGTWENNTFSLILGSNKGWSQGYYSKINESNLEHLAFESGSRELSFKNTLSNRYSLEVSGGNLHTTTRKMRIGDIKAWERYVFYGIEIVAINPLNLERFSYPSQFNNIVQSRDNRNIPYHTTGQYSAVYDFDMRNKTERDSFVNHVNKIPKGYIVMLLTHSTLSLADWEEEVFLAIESLGATQIRNFNEMEPYGVIGRKDMPYDDFHEMGIDPTSILPPEDQRYSIGFLIYPKLGSGSYTSTSVGPASSWKEFYYRIYPSEDSPTDTIKYSLIGITMNGTEELLLASSEALSRDLTAIDAEIYPYLKIVSNVSDTLNRTPLQQKRWTLLYEGVPEGSLMPDLAFEQSHDTLQEGDSLTIKIAYQNISSFTMDSVLVLAIQKNSSNNSVDTVHFAKYKPLAPNDSILLSYKIGTRGQAGRNRITLFVNPNFDQPEERLDNNSINLNYLVLQDEKNPLLDVVFDGVHIANNDIVSPSTIITMSVADDNKFLLINDPSSFTATLQGSNEFGQLIGTADSLNISKSDVVFYPAAKPGDKAVLEYSPKSLASGYYNLKVQVADATGNTSGNLMYEINFQVITESKITNLYPYPNPFTTAMKFVYTLTGDQIPDYMKIQILTVTGKVIREITTDELGTIKIGNNISEFTWNGTDEYGDQLANGVYLYRVIAKINGEDIEHRETEGDQYFNQGFGKIYLMR